MIVEQRIKEFEKLGFGMFVHFGLYSVHARGEWAYNQNITPEDYAKLFDRFCPEPDWAEQLVKTAKAAGCRYITLTTRHHDGFSLYDTCGLNTYDAPHSAAGRDLIREFTDACRAEGIVPFFYHTLLEWHDPRYKTDFKAYLQYLRDSVEILCTNYGKIGGLWFDGMWDPNNSDADWEEDALYSMIRSHQPDAMIINNAGMGARGAIGHKELDSVTFERGRPHAINTPDAPKYMASEMCQIFGLHWGYAKDDFVIKSMREIIEDYCVCRKYGANYLLNVGPMGNGYLSELDRAMLLKLGEWVKIQKEALYLPRPTEISVEGKEKDFLLRGTDCYYLFVHDLPMGGSLNVVQRMQMPEFTEHFTLSETIKEIHWLDSDSKLEFTQDGDQVTVCTEPFPYGTHLVVRVAKISV